MRSSQDCPILLVPDIHQGFDFLLTLLGWHPPETLAEIFLLGDLVESRVEK